MHATRTARGIGNHRNVRRDRAAFIFPAVLAAVAVATIGALLIGAVG